MATEFSLESVRQYMLAHEGKVTNHDLVKHYKAWLTHPTEKESARQKFKEYVNTLSTIQVENGIKFLVLKKRFFPTFADPSPQNMATSSRKNSSPSLLDEVMSTYSQQFQQPQNIRRQLPPTPNAVAGPLPGPPPPPYYKSPPPPSYRQPPPPPLPSSQPPFHNPPADFGLPLPADYGLPAPRQGVFHPPGPGSLVNYEMSKQYYPPPPLPRRNDPNMLSRSSSVMSMNSTSSRPQPAPNVEQQATATPPVLPTRNNVIKEPSPSVSSNASMTSNNSSRKTSISEDKENAEFLMAEKAKQEKISVKERTKTFNRMASEVEVTNLLKQSTGKKHTHNTIFVQNSSLKSIISSGVNRESSHNESKKRKNSSRSGRGSSHHRDDVDSHDSSSISTLDQAVKQWMVAAAKGDYLSLVKMLRDDPRLAKAKDFTSGYTALHWAAKHGNLDLVKLLAGNYSVKVNVRSHGGYTPLHLACQFSHEEVFDLLVKAYGGDPNMRDNSGKKPRQYMSKTVGYGVHNMSNDTFRQLKDRRRNRSRALADKNSGASGILRFGSLSVKVKKTTEAFNNYFHSEKKHSNSEQPYSLPTIGHPLEDVNKMPPPKFAPIKKRRSKRGHDFVSASKSAPVTPQETSPIKEERSDSDGEYGFDSQWSSNRR